jgi:hypothetical protein
MAWAFAMAFVCVSRAVWTLKFVKASISAFVLGGVAALSL